MNTFAPHAMPRTALANIDAVAKLEEEAEQRRTSSDKWADAIANFVGSIPFVVIHVAWFLVWVPLNLGLLSGIPRFDPYPFALLCMLVSLEGVLLSTFVLIKQNRMSQRADHRAHLDLQINLLTEKEVTKLIQMVEAMSRQMGAGQTVPDPEIRELSEVTAVENLAHVLDERLSPEEKSQM